MMFTFRKRKVKKLKDEIDRLEKENTKLTQDIYSLIDLPLESFDYQAIKRSYLFTRAWEKAVIFGENEDLTNLLETCDIKDLIRGVAMSSNKPKVKKTLSDGLEVLNFGKKREWWVTSKHFSTQIIFFEPPSKTKELLAKTNWNTCRLFSSTQEIPKKLRIKLLNIYIQFGEE